LPPSELVGGPFFLPDDVLADDGGLPFVGCGRKLQLVPFLGGLQPQKLALQRLVLCCFVAFLDLAEASQACGGEDVLGAVLLASLLGGS